MIAVTGGKGGVGKTCVSVNLATALARRWQAGALLDGDLGLANVDVLLGITPRFTLEHVHCRAVHAGGGDPGDHARVSRSFRRPPAWPACSELSTNEHLGLVQAFSNLTTGLDVLIVDTAAGIADGVRQFCQASQEVLVVVRDEPASLTDAYALVKVLRRDHGMTRFRVLANMAQRAGDGEALFRKLERVTGRFLDVVLEYAGEIPEDRSIRQAIREQRTVIEAYPVRPRRLAFKKLAKVVPIRGRRPRGRAGTSNSSSSVW